jgi:hypothetical protein
LLFPSTSRDLASFHFPRHLKHYENNDANTVFIFMVWV